MHASEKSFPIIWILTVDLHKLNWCMKQFRVFHLLVYWIANSCTFWWEKELRCLAVHSNRKPFRWNFESIFWSGQSDFQLPAVLWSHVMDVTAHQDDSSCFQLTWFVFPSASIVTWLATGGSSYMFKFSMMSLVCWIVDGQLWVAISCGSFKYTTITDILSREPSDFANKHKSVAIER